MYIVNKNNTQHISINQSETQFSNYFLNRVDARITLKSEMYGKLKREQCLLNTSEVIPVQNELTCQRIYKLQDP